jgi:hypothetical protein
MCLAHSPLFLSKINKTYLLEEIKMDGRKAVSQAKITIGKLQEGEDKSAVLSQAGSSFSQNAHTAKIKLMKWKDVAKNLKTTAAAFRASQTDVDFAKFEAALTDGCQFMEMQDADGTRVLNPAQRQKQLVALQACELEVQAGYRKTKFKFLQSANTLDAIEQAAKKEEESELEYSSLQDIDNKPRTSLSITASRSSSDDEISSPSMWATFFCCHSKDKRRERSVTYHASPSNDYTRLKGPKG